MQTPIQLFDQSGARHQSWARWRDKEFRLQKCMAFTYHEDIIDENRLIRTKDSEGIGSNPKCPPSRFSLPENPENLKEFNPEDHFPRGP